jgi:hypothetical protein
MTDATVYPNFEGAMMKILKKMHWMAEIVLS